jgi:hypothetical protein
MSLILEDIDNLIYEVLVEEGLMDTIKRKKKTVLFIFLAAAAAGGAAWASGYFDSLPVTPEEVVEKVQKASPKEAIGFVEKEWNRAVSDLKPITEPVGKIIDAGKDQLGKGWDAVTGTHTGLADEIGGA